MLSSGPDTVDLAFALPALGEHVRTLRVAARDYAARQGVAEPEDVALAISEAVSNAVRHAYGPDAPGEMRLTGERRNGVVTFVVEDDGRGLRPRTDSPGLGLGLGLIAQLADTFEIVADAAHGTTLRMSFAAAG